MDPCVGSAVRTTFADVPDPASALRDQLLDLITIAVICGAYAWEDTALLGGRKEAWLRTFLALPRGVPPHDTLGRVFAVLDPAQFEAGFLRWVQGVAASTAGGAGGVVAIDGKTARSAHAPGGNPLHLVSAWARAHRLVLGQEAADGKSNEIRAIPALLARLELREQVVTIDAMGCQRAIAAQGGDYVLAVKANQPALLEGIRTSFALASDAIADQSRTMGKGHGRIKVRTCRTIDDPQTIAWLNPDGAWAGAQGIAQVTGEWRIDGVVTQQTRYYVSSLPGEARTIAAAVRGH